MLKGEDQLAKKDDKLRQAVVIIHGMGDQKPLDTLKGFIEAALPPATRAGGGTIEPAPPPASTGARQYYSRPDEVSGSYEARRYLAPRCPTFGHGEVYAQTEFYEYHWAHHMQGNRINDMLPTLRRLLLQLPSRVPSGLKIVWALMWGALLFAIWALWRGPFSGLDLSNIDDKALITLLFGGGLATIGIFLVRRFLSWITKSFVDVVRYLDTSPRSYEVRSKIRAGIVQLLQGLHETNRYERIVVVAHSLGAYIAYDGIAHLWGKMNTLPEGPAQVPNSPAGLEELERAASNLTEEEQGDYNLEAFRRAQQNLWTGIRGQKNPWLITDFVSVGTPMYFADRLYTKNRQAFLDKVRARELPTAPPQPDPAEYNNIHDTRLWYSWRNEHGRRLLYESAPFAVVRWTNLWYPASGGFFGDWFGGPLAPLFGLGVKDIKVRGNRPYRWLPGGAHTRYFRQPDDIGADSATTYLRDALGLDSTDWLRPRSS